MMTGEAGPPSGTYTMLFTDIERSTRMLEQLGDEGYALVLGEHRRICREAFDLFAGTEVDTQGDSFFVVFERASDAAAAAEHAQEGLSQTPVRVRMGLHTGNPIVRDGMYVGLDVHRAARVASVAHGCQIVVSSTCSAELSARDELFSLGLHRLKDFDEPIELFQLGAGHHPPLRSIAPTNLPTPASSFVGRELELGQAEELRQHARMVTVVGTGGTGKTRFAIELARRTAASYPGGTWFVSLSATTDPSLVLPAIASAMGIDDVGNGVVDAISHRVAGLPTSILLDNLEQLREAGEGIADLIAQVPVVSILATSRTPLFITGEEVLELGVLAGADGEALFIERARSAGRMVPVGDPTVARLCARVDGLPLAIELLAARARIMSPAQMLTSLGNPLDIESKQRDMPSRHRTVRSTLTWSHTLLNDAEQRAFAALSIFADGWSIEAAQEVCECDVEVLQALVEHSLVRVRFSLEGESRSWMLELVRAFAAEQLDSDRGAVLRDRLALRCMRVACELSPRLNTREQEAAFAWFDAELEDLRTVAHRVIDQEDPGAGAYVLSLHAYLWRRGRADEGNLLVARALTVPSLPDFDRAQLHSVCAVNAMIRGNLPLAEEHLQEALALSETVDDQDLRLRLLGNHGHLFMMRGEPDAAREVWAQCRAEAVAHGKHREAALIDWNFGSLAAASGDWEEAVVHFEASRSFHRSIDDTFGVAWLSGLLGWAHTGRGDEVAARSSLLEAFVAYERLGMGPGLESALIGLATFLRGPDPAASATAVAWFDHLYAEGMDADQSDLANIDEVRSAVAPIEERKAGNASECASWATQLLAAVTSTG